MNAIWSDAEKDFILRNAHLLKDWQIASALFSLTGRKVSPSAVRQQRQRLGIKKAHGRGICRVLPRPTPTASLSLVIHSSGPPA